MEMENLVHDFPLAVDFQQREKIRKSIAGPIARFNANGSVDTTFGSNGVVTTPVFAPAAGFGSQRTDAVLVLSNGEILVGTSRKAFLGSLTGDGIEETLVGTVAVSLAAAAGGASLFRVHDVAEHVAALRVFQTIRNRAGR